MYWIKGWQPAALGRHNWLSLGAAFVFDLEIISIHEALDLE